MRHSAYAVAFVGPCKIGYCFVFALVEFASGDFLVTCDCGWKHTFFNDKIFVEIFFPLIRSNLETQKDHRQTVQSHIRSYIKWHLIRVYIVC